jgi:hypothetical protein
VDIGRYLRDAWAVIQPAWVEVWLTLLLLNVATGMAFALCFLPGLIVMGPLWAGGLLYMAKRMLGRPAQIADLGKGFQRFTGTTVLALVLFLVPAVLVVLTFLPLFVATTRMSDQGGPLGAIFGISTAIGFVLGPLLILAYSLVVGTFGILAMPLVLFRDQDAITALKTSFGIVRPRIGEFILLLLTILGIFAAVSVVGYLIPCVGWIVSLLAVPLANALVFALVVQAYRDFVGLTPQDVERFG